MAGTQSRKFAFLATILMIVAAIYLGGLRSLYALRSTAEEYYYVGSERSNSVVSYLEAEVSTARNLLTVAARYIPEDDSGALKLEDVAYELDSELYINPSLAAQKSENLKQEFTLLADRLDNMTLSDSDSDYVRSLRSSMNSRQNQIAGNPYNEAAQKYNDAIQQFPANLLSEITGAKPLDLL